MIYRAPTFTADELFAIRQMVRLQMVDHLYQTVSLSVKEKQDTLGIVRDVFGVTDTYQASILDALTLWDFAAASTKLPVRTIMKSEVYDFLQTLVAIDPVTHYHMDGPDFQDLEIKKIADDINLKRITIKKALDEAPTINPELTSKPSIPNIKPPTTLLN